MAEKKKGGLFSAFSSSSSSSSSSATTTAAAPPAAVAATPAKAAAPASSSTSTTSSSSSAVSASPAAPAIATTSSMNLLRLHIIQAQLQKDCDPYAIVSVGKKSAKTRQLKRSEDPKLATGHLAAFDEHFVIEYETQDEEVLDLKVGIYEKGMISDDVIGEWKLKLNLVDKPTVEELPPGAPKKKSNKKEMKESWYTEQPKEMKLLDKSGKKEVGTLSIRVRRETKVIGQVQIKVKEATLPSDADTKLNIKFGTQTHTLDAVKGKKGKFVWKATNYTLDANMSNNVKDIFIECVQAEKVMGEVRVTLFDAKRKAVKKPQPILSHENKSKIGEMKLSVKVVPPPVAGKK